MEKSVDLEKMNRFAENRINAEQEDDCCYKMDKELKTDEWPDRPIMFETPSSSHKKHNFEYRMLKFKDNIQDITYLGVMAEEEWESNNEKKQKIDEINMELIKTLQKTFLLYRIAIQPYVLEDNKNF